MASRDQLGHHGVDDATLKYAVASGAVLRIRSGWVALPTAPPDVVAAVRVGGRLSCLSRLRHEDIWCLRDSRLHVRVAPTARRLASPHDRAVPLGRPERFGVVVHRSLPAPYLDEPEGAVDSFAWALLHATVCQPRLDAIVTLDSALKNGRVSRTELDFAFAHLPSKCRAYLELTDENAASGLETKARLGLQRYNIRSRSQVEIRGVGFVDLLIGERLVIEVDGREWHVVDILRALVARDEHRWAARHRKAGLGTGAELV
ncbi:MAG: hypothetical protein Q7T71_17230 [Herbiconiux sp.]|nr:hypothetical protein [Herbiconiux sp.]